MQVKCIIPFTGFEPPIQVSEGDVQRKLFPKILRTKNSKMSSKTFMIKTVKKNQYKCFFQYEY